MPPHHQGALIQSLASVITHRIKICLSSNLLVDLSNWFSVASRGASSSLHCTWFPPPNIVVARSLAASPVCCHCLPSPNADATRRSGSPSAMKFINMEPLVASLRPRFPHLENRPGREMLLTSSGYRSGMLFNILQYTRQPPQQRIISLKCQECSS